MTSLAEAYERRAGEAGRGRVYLGTGLFVAGALLVLGSILAGATSVLLGLGFAVGEAREIAGVLAGLGVPAVFVGVFAVLPASPRERAAATVGAGVAVLGVTLFRSVYPEQWLTPAHAPTTAALGVVAVYFLGTITTFWCLFTAVATFKTRNDPGGTVTLRYDQNGETKTVEVAADDADEARAALGGNGGGSSGGVGVFGGIDDPGADSSGGRSAGTGPASTADGGVRTEEITPVGPADEDGGVAVPGEAAASDPADAYCGSCAHFEYVRTHEGIRPYCRAHTEVMDDMDPCERWEANT
jgi:disulfide bond formation protein DsbB